MAQFFTTLSGLRCSVGSKVCKKCQNKYNTERTKRRLQQNTSQSSRGAERTTMIDQVTEPPKADYSEPVPGPSWDDRPEAVAGPSWNDLDTYEDDIDDAAGSLSSLSLTTDPSVFSPLSFTPSSRKKQAFHFPSVSGASEGGLSDSPMKDEALESGDADEHSSEDDGDDSGSSDDEPGDEPSEESSDQDEEEEAPEYGVTVSGHSSCIFGLFFWAT